MTFDMSQYRTLALRTEAPVSDKALRQLVRCYDMFKDIMEEARDNAPLIDKLKRFGIYGKDDEEFVEQLPPIYPVGDKAERIRQCYRLLHALIGIIGECGEASEKVLAYIEGDEKELDIENLFEEGGDIIWFLNLMIAFCGPRDLVDVASGNLFKLMERFKEKFTLEEYSLRDRSKEMAAMTKAM